MGYTRSRNNGSTIIVRMICAAVFVSFTFLWLYFFQNDLLAVTQHILSQGQTHYNRLVGAILITVALQLLQIGAYMLTGLSRQFHALTYFPSMIALATLSDIVVDAEGQVSFGGFYWAVIPLLLLWGALVWALRNLQSYEKEVPVGLFSRCMWVNLLLMVVVILGAVFVSNTNAVLHYRVHAEMELCRGQVDEALAVGRKSLETDAHLTMLRAYALSRKGELGERFFQYAIEGDSRSLLPLGGVSRLLVYPADSLYAFLGARPKGQMSVQRYLQLLQERGLASAAVKDYLLTGWLVDRNLDAFAQAVGQYYVLQSDSLPRHYREALVLYKHLRSQPVVTYADAVIDEDYDDLQALESEYADAAERRVRVEEKYRGSYWCYYLYQPTP